MVFPNPPMHIAVPGFHLPGAVPRHGLNPQLKAKQSGLLCPVRSHPLFAVVFTPLCPGSFLHHPNIVALPEPMRHTASMMRKPLP